MSRLGSAVVAFLRWFRSGGRRSVLISRGFYAAFGHIMAAVDAIAADPDCVAALEAVDVSNDSQNAE